MNNKINILIVEDDVVFCKMLSKFFGKNGFLTHDSQSVDEAFEILQQNTIDIAIVDYRLPGKNGLELLAWIKKEKPAVKVVIVSRVNEKEISDKAYELGAEEYITKPINPTALLEKIKAIKTTKA
ncbi:MAG: response regulator [Cytophagaceae bacterium]